ncbi:HAD-IA family hydrolase [Paenibacillus sp. Marseille-Q4541]|uniref:HAD family hydrolase n=1 Tax=Paenibacillus sp. Marseille-Q4541 TaxID=2831522 RepID=UPI001BA92985|nr:HAD-IA family hydrolase [Paenibacillus sp. Marseille-Q4541]
MAIQLIDGHHAKVKGILFDKDGTLLNFISLWGSWCEILIHQVNKRIEERIPVHPSLASLPSIFGVICDEQGKIVDYDTEGLLSTGTMADMQSVIIHYSEQAGIGNAEAHVIAYESMKEAYQGIERSRPVQARANIMDVLAQCRKQGVLLAVVTADETDDAVKHLEWLGLSNYFETIVGTDQVRQGKPSPDMIYLACERLGILPSEVAVIGDTDSDMQMGKAAGVAITVAIFPEDKAETRIGRNLMPYRNADVLITSYIQLLAGLKMK